MSKLGKTALSAMLLAVAVSCSLAGTLPNDETEVLDLQEYLESSRGVPTKHKADGALLREKRQFRLNDYQIELYLNLRLLQASNCTETFLNQTVSPHLCNSKWVLYTPLTAPFEGSGERNDPIDLYTYELCSYVTLFNDEDVILGHDVVFFRRTVNADATLEVFLLQTRNDTPPWLELVSHRTIAANSSGWQVFHLQSRVYSLVEKSVCIILFVRETTITNGSRPLSRRELEERFVLDDASPSEANNKPFIATFIISNGTLPFFPFLGKRSAEKPGPVGCSASTECRLQSHFVDLSTHIGADILYPPEADLGRCDSKWQSTAHDDYPPTEHETENELGSGKGGEESLTTDLYQCAPTIFDDLAVLFNFYGTIVLTSVPDLVITECGVQPCREA